MHGDTAIKSSARYCKTERYLKSNVFYFTMVWLPDKLDYLLTSGEARFNFYT